MCKRHQVKGQIDGETIRNKNSSLNKTRKAGKKSVLRESRLKLPPNIASVLKKQKNMENETSEVNEENCNLKGSSKKGFGININKSCSMEFRNSSLSSMGDCPSVYSQSDCYDNDSDELAEYFEQALYLPKPMSAMAEMMYG